MRRAGIGAACSRLLLSYVTHITLRRARDAHFIVCVEIRHAVALLRRAAAAATLPREMFIAADATIRAYLFSHYMKMQFDI